MPNQLFNAENITNEPLYWWFGQIVDDLTWRDNETREKWKDYGDLKGWGSRYRVRIFGRDTGDIPDERLDMAEVLYPVTAGSGHASSWQSSNLRQGAYVVGFYRDGSDMEDPVIMGCFANQDQTKLSTTVPVAPFEPFSGFAGGQGVPFYAITPSGSPTPANGDPSAMEGASAASTLRTSMDDVETEEDARVENPIQSKCEKVELEGIGIVIKNLIQDIEKAKKTAKTWENSIIKPINYKGEQMSVSDYISMKVGNASADITKFYKEMVDGIRKNTTEKLNNLFKDTYYNLFPNARPDLKIKIEKANDLISCLFNNIIGNLLNTVRSALQGILDKVINVASCIVENIIGGITGALSGVINKGLNIAIRPIEALVGKAFDIGGSVLGFVEGFLKGFPTCEEDLTCGGGKAWGAFTGSPAPKIKLNVDSIFNNVKQFSKMFESILNMDLSDLFSGVPNLGDLIAKAQGCFSGPFACGPPNVSIYGMGGGGSLANAVVSATGDVLGLDIIASGFGFKKAPIIALEDSCGKGKGAVIKPIMGVVVPKEDDDGNIVFEDDGVTPVFVPSDDGRTVGPGFGEPGALEDMGLPADTQIGVVGAVVVEPGFGYLPTPNGDQGGDGRVWADKCQTTVFRLDGTYDTPYDEGEVIDIKIGDTVKFPGQPEFVAIEDKSVTAPGCPPEPGDPLAPGTTATTGRGSLPTEPSTTSNQYPAVLYLCQIYVTNGGVNYSEGDTITITPDLGAVAKPIIGPFGVIERIDVITTGTGYKERPDIRIETTTGYNAELNPVLCVNRIGDATEEELLAAQEGDRIISIVDCVGKH